LTQIIESPNCTVDSVHTRQSKVVPVLNKGQCHDDMWEWKFLILALNGVEWSISLLHWFSPRERIPVHMG